MVVCRFLTGLGIGGMLAATNAVTAESSNSKSAAQPGHGALCRSAIRSARSSAAFAASELAAGRLRLARGVRVRRGRDRGADPGGAAAGARDRRPSSRDPAARRARAINRTLRAFGKPQIAALPAIAPTAPKPKVTDILSNPRLRPVTLLLAFGYMFHTITFYYILKFAVQIVADYPPAIRQPDAATRADLGQCRRLHRQPAVRLRDGASWDIKWPTVADAADRLGGGGRVRHRAATRCGAGSGRRS